MHPRIQTLLSNAEQWSNDRQGRDPDFFNHLADHHHPDVMWFGCSDSRVMESVMTGVEPGELFIVRNIANQVRTESASVMSAIDFAVSTLKVKHVVVCGHTNCGGLLASQSPLPPDTSLEDWLGPVHQQYQAHKAALVRIEDRERRSAAHAQLNVYYQLLALSHIPLIAAKLESDEPFHLHGLVFHLREGRFEALPDACVERPEQLSALKARLVPTPI